MTEKNPATEQATTVEAQPVTAHSVSEKAVFETEKSGASTSDKRAAIKQALRPQLRRTSVVEDYAAELDEMASLTHALNGSKKTTIRATPGKSAIRTIRNWGVKPTRKKSEPCRLSF